MLRLPLFSADVAAITQLRVVEDSEISVMAELSQEGGRQRLLGHHARCEILDSGCRRVREEGHLRVHGRDVGGHGQSVGERVGRETAHVAHRGRSSEDGAGVAKDLQLAQRPAVGVALIVHGAPETE